MARMKTLMQERIENITPDLGKVAQVVKCYHAGMQTLVQTPRIIVQKAGYGDLWIIV